MSKTQKPKVAGTTNKVASSGVEPNAENVNRNEMEVDLASLPDFEGKRILKVANRVIGERPEDNGFKALLDDGTWAFVPTSFFGENN